VDTDILSSSFYNPSDFKWYLNTNITLPRKTQLPSLQGYQSGYQFGLVVTRRKCTYGNVHYVLFKWNTEIKPLASQHISNRCWCVNMCKHSVCFKHKSSPVV
ncbi:hypothetical protein MKW98_020545, partial [Papaver atlanticum]